MAVDTGNSLVSPCGCHCACACRAHTKPGCIVFSSEPDNPDCLFGEKRKDWRPVRLQLWFLLCLSPALPEQNHEQHYQDSGDNASDEKDVQRGSDAYRIAWTCCGEISLAHGD